MTRIRTLLAVCAFALAIPAVVAGCGDDDSSSSDADPQEVLDATFGGDHEISSGNLDLAVGVSAEGDQGGSFEISLSGPFQGDPEDSTAVPQLDLTASAGGEGGGEDLDFEGGLVVTEDNAYIEYQDQAYEVGADTFNRAQRQVGKQVPENSEEKGASFREVCEQALSEGGGGDASACDIDVTEWLAEPQTEGTEDVEGVETTHVASGLDVEAMLTDIGALAAAIPGTEASGFDPSQLGGFSGAVTDASFDVFSGVDDDILRKLEAEVAIDPSQLAVGGAVPVDSIDIDFSLTFSDVNEEQTIEAPSDAKPIEDFLSETGLDDLGALGLGGGLGGAGGLEDLGGGGGGLEDLGGGGGGGAGGGGGGGGGAVDPDAAQNYLDCIADAAGDPDKINDCASEL